MSDAFSPPTVAGRLLRRPPSNEDLAKRGSCHIGARDLDILAAVGTHGLLTAELLNVAFFWQPGHESLRPCSHAYERLRQLWLWGLLDRYDLPAPRGALGSVPALYALGERGLTLLTRRGAAPPAFRAHHLVRRGAIGIEHELTVAAVWAHLHVLVRQRRLIRCQWMPERVLRAKHMRVVDPNSGRSLPVLLDGEAEVETSDGGVRRLLVEVDRGTLTLQRFRRKLRAWEQYDGHGRNDRGAAEGTVLVLAPSWPRLSNLWKVARLEVPAGRHARYRFATMDVLHPVRFGENDAWLSLVGTYLGPFEEQQSTATEEGGNDDHTPSA